MYGFGRVHLTQFLGAWFYLVNREMYYAYMAVTKESFGLLVTTMTHWWAPTVIRISGDESVAGQLSLTPDGRVECAFPDRMVMIANHQVRNLALRQQSHCICLRGYKEGDSLS